MDDHLDSVVQFNLVSMGLLFLSASRRIDADTVYTMQQAAFLVDCEYKSIFHAIKNKHLTAGGIGRTPRIKGCDLLDWMKAGGRTGRKGQQPIN